MSAATHCQLPGCSNAVEQPSGGGPRKRFCCDTHRLQYWRQSQKESKLGAVAEESFLGNDPSAVLALRDQLEQSVQTLEAAMTRARTTLIELSSLEQAEAVRKEALASADEMVARAQASQASEERRRQAAEECPRPVIVEQDPTFHGADDDAPVELRHERAELVAIIDPTMAPASLPGLQPGSGLAAFSRMVDMQAVMLATNDFYAMATILILVFAGVIWLAKRPKGPLQQVSH